MRFVLVHGGFHAAWWWSRAIQELERLGHQAIAVDLPGHGDRVEDESTLDNCREAIVSVLRPGGVLVGHSGGGFDATRAADAATDLVSHVVCPAAALPREGCSHDAGKMLGYLHFSDDGAMTFADLQGAWEYFWHDRRVALPVAISAAGTGRAGCPCDDHQTPRPLDPN